jgi:hypothetical protein
VADSWFEMLRQRLSEPTEQKVKTSDSINDSRAKIQTGDLTNIKQNMVVMTYNIVRGTWTRTFRRNMLPPSSVDDLGDDV